MSWTDFTNYLQEKIIQLKEYSSQEEWELTPFAKEKFSAGVSQEEVVDLERNLNFLLASYQQRFDFNDDFHKLPEIEKEEGEESEEEPESSDDEENEKFNFSPKLPRKSNFSEPKKELKTWTELFPTRESLLLGKSNYGAASFKTYNLLGKIYEDWRLLGEKAKELEKKAEDWKKRSEELMKEYLARQAKKFFQKKGIDFLGDIKQWLKDYEDLDKNQQQELKDKKEKMEEILTFIGTEFSEEKKEPKSWFKSLDWKSIAISAGIGLVLTILAVVVWKYVKKCL